MIGIYSKDEILKFAIENGMLDLSNIQAQIEMNNRKEYLSKHTYEIWMGKNGLWYTYLPDKEKKRVLKKRKTKADIENCIIDYYEKEDTEPDLEKVFNDWIDSKLAFGEIQKQTYDRYKTDFVRFFKDSAISEARISSITEYDLELFIKRSIADKSLSSKAYSGLRILVMGIFKYAKKMSYSKISITQFFGDMEISRNAFSKRVEVDEESVFRDCEIEKIIGFINSNPTIINLGIMLAFQTGLRVGELAALQFSDVSENYICVNKTEVRYRGDSGEYVFDVRESAKTDAGNRMVIISPAARETIEKVRKMNPFGKYMFMENGKRLKEKAFATKIVKICNYLGIEPRSMHKIRKTYATKLINAGVDERLIIKQLGHTDISCTKSFYYYNNKSTDEAERQISNAINI